MFCRVIPNWDQINHFKQPLTEGELTLIRYLDANLKRDDNFNENFDLNNYKGWLIYVQPYLNGCRPDIIIFHPKIGVQIFEVKDWNLNNFSFHQNENCSFDFLFNDDTGSYSIKSPVNQVEYYKQKLIGQLIPQIGESMDQDIMNYGLVKTAVYFHKSTTQESQNLFAHQIKNFLKFPVFGYDFLKKENTKEIIPGCVLSYSKFWNEDWNTEIINWLNPPFHSLEQTIQLKLNKHQEKFSDPLPGHYRVRGVAGSGKTQVLAYRAGKMASQEGEVLILTFNITLWHYIHDMIQRSPFKFSWKKITLNHFHGFCNDILNDFGLRWPTEYGDNESVYKEIVPNMVLSAIQNGNFKKYDAILIDEGQDYYIEWYKMLCQFLSTRDELLVVCDKKQNIYGREMEWLDKRRTGVEKFGDWIELKTIVRLPNEIAIKSKEFSEKFNLNQDVKYDKVEPPDLFNQYTPHLVWWNINQNEWLKMINESFEIIKSNATSKHLSDTVILLPDKNFGFEAVEYFGNKGINVNHVFEKDDEKRFHKHKKAFWLGDSRLKISTIHSFKGWEVLNVIIFIPEIFQGDVELFDMNIYTAITRTRQNLIVINANQRYWEFGKGISDKWEK